MHLPISIVLNRFNKEFTNKLPVKRTTSVDDISSTVNNSLNKSSAHAQFIENRDGIHVTGNTL